MMTDKKLKALTHKLNEKVGEFLLEQFNSGQPIKASLVNAAVQWLRTHDLSPTPAEVEESASELTKRPELILRLPFVSDETRAKALAQLKAQKNGINDEDGF
jgi:hypothetical protein